MNSVQYIGVVYLGANLRVCFADDFTRESRIIRL